MGIKFLLARKLEAFFTKGLVIVVLMELLVALRVLPTTEFLFTSFKNLVMLVVLLRALPGPDLGWNLLKFESF